MLVVEVVVKSLLSILPLSLLLVVVVVVALLKNYKSLKRQGKYCLLTTVYTIVSTLTLYTLSLPLLSQLLSYRTRTITCTLVVVDVAVVVDAVVVECAVDGRRLKIEVPVMEIGTVVLVSDEKKKLSAASGRILGGVDKWPSIHHWPSILHWPTKKQGE